MTHLEINELSALTNILAAGLAAVPARPLDLPPEVAQALAEARRQMGNLPEVIRDFNLTADRFQSVAAALTGMIDLADRAAAEETDDDSRLRLDAEFIDLSKIVAADAGRMFYQGPSLNLRSRGEALSAAKVVRYLSPVIENMDRELAEQGRLIHEVIAETISFLNIVTQCYPEAEWSPTLNFLVETARPYCREAAPARLH